MLPCLLTEIKLFEVLIEKTSKYNSSKNIDLKYIDLEIKIYRINIQLKVNRSKKDKHKTKLN